MIGKLRDDLNQARREKDNVKKGVLSLVIGNYQLAEKEKKSPLTKDEAFAIIYKEIKQTNESLEDYKAGKREDLIAEAEMILEILKSYLPKQYTADEIKEIVSEEIKQLDASKPGLVMKELMPKFKNKADGKLVNKIIQECLNDLKA